MLRPECGAEMDAGARGERIEAMGEVGGDRSGMGEQGNPLPLERGAERGVGEQPFDTEFHHSGSNGGR